jgi:hypothetical protein
MSAPRTTRRTATFTAVAGATTVLLIGLGPAAAGSAGPDLDPCTNSVAGDTQWPGTLVDDPTQSVPEAQILEFDWRRADVVRERQILEFDWRHHESCRRLP